SRRIRHDIRRIGLTHMPDAPSYRVFRESRDYLRWQIPVGRIRRFYAASGKLQQTTFNHAF
ncbi:TPA: hypothetical protein ACIYKP_004170, partial [Escherichia coli]